MKKAIGIDLGGTSIYGGIIDENGKVLKRASRDSQAHQGRQGYNRISEDRGAMEVKK